MRNRSALVLIIFMFISACNLPARAAFATAEPLGPSKEFPSPVPSVEPPGFDRNLSDTIVQLPDGSSALHFNGGQVTKPDGSTQNVEPFWITATLITNQQYRQCVEAGGCTLPDQGDNQGYQTCWWGPFPYPCLDSNPSNDTPRDDNPSVAVFSVTGVTLDQASTYCQWIGGSLPTSGQNELADEKTKTLLLGLLNSPILILSSPTPPHVSACDLKPAGSPGCPASTVSACDLMPAGSPGCPTKAPNTSACDFKPAGSPGCPVSTVSACDLMPAGSPGCPTKAPNTSACDLLPAGSPGCPAPKASACDFMPAGSAGCPTKVVPPIKACDLQPGGCPPEPAGSTENLFAVLINGILLGPSPSGFGTFSDDSSQGGGGSYNSPVGEPIKANGNTHLGNIGFKCVIKDVNLYAPYCQTSSYIPSTNGNYPAPVCPNVTIEQKGDYCSSKQPFVNVDIKQAQFSWADPPANCTEDPAYSTPDSTRLVCSGPSSTLISIHAQSQCSAPADWKPEAVCLTGYSYDAVNNKCVYDGFETGANACPTGFTYSSQEQCCVAAKDYQPVCAPGYYPSPLGCVAYDSTYLQVDQNVSLASCGGSGPASGPTGCTLSCPAGMYPDATCSVCTGKP